MTKRKRKRNISSIDFTKPNLNIISQQVYISFFRFLFDVFVKNVNVHKIYRFYVYVLFHQQKPGINLKIVNKRQN